MLALRPWIRKAVWLEARARAMALSSGRAIPSPGSKDLFMSNEAVYYIDKDDNPAPNLTCKVFAWVESSSRVTCSPALLSKLYHAKFGFPDRASRI